MIQSIATTNLRGAVWLLPFNVWSCIFGEGAGDKSDPPSASLTNVLHNLKRMQVAGALSNFHSNEWVIHSGSGVPRRNVK